MTVDRARRRTRTVTLRDGARVKIRPISPNDKDLVVEAFERLSPESRYRRFLKPMLSLSPEVLEQLTDVDHDRHEALVAIDPESGQLIGTARYIRDREHPEVAEVAAAVTDDWQGRGVGRALLERLTSRARSEGVRSFTALVLAENRSARDLLSSIGTSVQENAAGPETQLVIELPARRGLGAQLTDVLRAAAAGGINPARDFLANRAAEPQPPRWPVDPARALEVVVVGTDGSETAAHAVAAAVELSTRFHAMLHIVCAHTGQEVPDSHRVLEAAAATARRAGIEASVHARPEDPASALTAVAVEVSSDLIVVGNRGMSGLRRFVLGSVPNAVSHQAPCSVLIVRTTP